MELVTLKELAGTVTAAGIAAGSAIVGHLVDVTHNGARFTWIQVVVIVVLAAWWGMVLDSSLPKVPGRGAAIALVGLGALPAYVAARAAIPGIVSAIVDRFKALIGKG